MVAGQLRHLLRPACRVIVAEVVELIMKVPAVPRWLLLVGILLLPAAAGGRLLAQTGTLYGTLEIVWGDPQTGGEAITH